VCQDLAYLVIYCWEGPTCQSSLLKEVLDGGRGEGLSLITRKFQTAAVLLLRNMQVLRKTTNNYLPGYYNYVLACELSEIWLIYI